MAHYCQGVLAGDTLYAAGQIASDYRTGVPPAARQDPAFPYYGSDIQKQTRYVLENIQSVYRAAGCELNDTVKAQVFLTDLDDFHPFDQVWREFFPSPPPRTTVQVGALLVPGCRIEIDLIAVHKRVARTVVTGRGAPTPMAHYCQGVLAGETLYAAGQIASDYKTGVAPEARQDPAFPYYGSDIQKQTRYVLQNLRSVFEAAGCGLKDVVKSQVFLTDLNDFYYLRPDLEGVLSRAAAAHHGADQRPARARMPRGDRPDRSQSLIRRSSDRERPRHCRDGSASPSSTVTSDVRSEYPIGFIPRTGTRAFGRMRSCGWGERASQSGHSIPERSGRADVAPISPDTDSHSTSACSRRTSDQSLGDTRGAQPTRPPGIQRQAGPREYPRRAGRPSSGRHSTRGTSGRSTAARSTRSGTRERVRAPLQRERPFAAIEERKVHPVHAQLRRVRAQRAAHPQHKRFIPACRRAGAA